MIEIRSRISDVKPFLKWAGGKSQLLKELNQFVPKNYNRYVEAFLGGGALFFHLRPNNAVLSDLNPELINCYQVVRDNVESLIIHLKDYKNTPELFYSTRALDLTKLSDIERASRFIFLNRTCFNGLYRENKKGNFNVPFGNYKNPRICDEETLYNASVALKNATLICGDYKSVLMENVQSGDFVFLDPPYYPVSKYGDFQRYTKDFFYDTDHLEVRDEIIRLVELGAKVLSTNSNTVFINEIYSSFPRSVVESKRLISRNPKTRTGQDLIIYATGESRISNTNEELIANFPGTRYMGSKLKILPFLWDAISKYQFKNVLDAFSGSGCVSYMLKRKGIEVYSNDFMSFSSSITKALIENSSTILTETDIKQLLSKNSKASSFISTTFHEIYFSQEDNSFLDNLRANIENIEDPIKKAIAIAAITRSCMKKRPRGIFTYTGDRYNDGRRDLQLTLMEHFLENVESFNLAVFNNNKNNLSFNSDIFELDIKADLVYFDPPYMTSKSDNDYVRRYHFVEGLARNWKGLKIQENTKTKKFEKYPSPFDSKNTVNDALDRLFEKFKDSIIVISYSSNSIPSKEEMIRILGKYKKNIELKEIDYQYSFGNHNHKVGQNANKVKEYLFIGS